MMCDEKVMHRTMEAAAQRALTDLEDHGFKNRPYECPICGCWHLTSKPMHGAESVTADHVRTLAIALGITKTHNDQAIVRNAIVRSDAKLERMRAAEIRAAAREIRRAR